MPGNHDVPLFNLLARFARPLANYRRYITPNLQPIYCDDELLALGLNTTRSLTIKGGRLKWDQVRWSAHCLQFFEVVY